jgi:hypothetical protein
MDKMHMDMVISDKISTKKKVQASLSKLENMIQRVKISDESKNSKGGAKQADRASKSKNTNANFQSKMNGKNVKKKQKKSLAQKARMVQLPMPSRSTAL